MNRSGFLLVVVICAALSIRPFIGNDALAQPDGKGGTAKADLEKLQGTWFHASRDEGGKQVVGEDKEILWVFRGSVFVSKQRDRVWSVGTVKIVDANSNPKKMDLVITDGANEGMTILTVYEVDDGIFRYCGCVDARPATFATTKDDKNYTYCSTYKRLKR